MRSKRLAMTQKSWRSIPNPLLKSLAHEGFECFDINNNAMILVTKVHWALGVLLEATSFSARS